MPTPTIPAGNLFMNATLYTGNGTALTVTNGVAGQAFQPDFVWIKGRNYADNHTLWNTVVGAQKSLSSDTTTAETTRANALTAFTSTGFTLGTDTIVNYSLGTYVGWQWKAGGTAVTNTSGTISSQVSANTTSGFSVVTYTGNGTQPSTVGHGLGIAPSMVIVKTRNSALYDWNSYHISLGNTQYIALNTTGAASSAANLWNNTTPTSTVFTVNHVAVNTSSNTYVAYCWTPIAGYSAFGSYTGNGSSDGPFVYTGFRPRFIMIKRTDGVGNWSIYDTARDTYNAMTQVLFSNLSDAEINNTATIDYLSNGFKLRIATYQPNTSGATFVYAAFAENPLKFANAR
jgi:hypothetical protein